MIPAIFRSYTFRYFAGSVCSGLLLAASFPPLGLSNLAWVAMIPLMIVLRDMPLRQAFGWGWLSGLVFWLFSVSWLLRLAETGTNIFVAVPAWISLAAYCAVYTGAFTLVTAAVWQAIGSEKQWQSLWMLMVVPSMWVGFEYLRSTLFTGFSWNALGICQYRQIQIIQVSQLGGVYAVSAFVMVVNTALTFMAIRFMTLLSRQKIRRVNVELMILLGTWLFCIWCYYDAVKVFKGLKNATSVRIASVQPNIPQDKKWPEKYGNAPDAVERETKLIYDKIREQAELAILARPDLIVLPETCVPSLVKRDPACAAFISDLASRGSPILVGSMDCDLTADRDIFFNSSMLFDARGRLAGEYTKRHLVVFGEYLPFESVFPVIARMAPLGYSCTPGTTSTVFRLEKPAITFSSLICFEDTVASLACESVRNGARLLINQTNDAWFDGSAAAVQHMAHCVFRCVENRVPAVRSANTGVTCFIDSLGMVKCLEQDGRRTCFAGFTVDSIQIPPANMDLTFYTLNGDAAFAMPCGMSAVLVLAWAFLVIRIKEREPGNTRCS